MELTATLYPQIRRHVERLWAAVNDLRRDTRTHSERLADHDERLEVVEGAIMERSARYEHEAAALARMQADIGARLEVGGRVIAGDIETPDN